MLVYLIILRVGDEDAEIVAISRSHLTLAGEAFRAVCQVRQVGIDARHLLLAIEALGGFAHPGVLWPGATNHVLLAGKALGWSGKVQTREEAFARAIACHGMAHHGGDDQECNKDLAAHATSIVEGVKCVCEEQASEAQADLIVVP